jgi:hypothetical protein
LGRFHPVAESGNAAVAAGKAGYLTQNYVVLGVEGGSGNDGARQSRKLSAHVGLRVSMSGNLSGTGTDLWGRSQAGIKEHLHHLHSLGLLLILPDRIQLTETAGGSP